ncbi:GNAT family N-acetyltransferase [Galbibacter pacificus]|uniref:GNAT family N-acetyltransferase n=1 Tax=Galbibacter pacificus TaxID=2996052 RepID=A0ABT6FX43_9FLAO|nr:GNAT family N-acetyltransferase [Galbibacter pacificus]MDG3584189.1 GNAT family N-acetyltransferase [Galbibacter pacificus]MDG3587677.1 GNAT family N-acetyltransferase [Galbibacter pacificus]
MLTSEILKGDFLITTDKEKLDVPFIHRFLSTEAGWCDNIPLETVQKSIDNSLNFGLFHNDKQIGFARIITDYATIAYLGDVFILNEYRKQGLSKWLMEVVTNHPELQNLRRWMLITDTAPWLYEKFGFAKVKGSNLYMEKHFPNVYKKD